MRTLGLDCPWSAPITIAAGHDDIIHHPGLIAEVVACIGDSELPVGMAQAG